MTESSQPHSGCLRWVSLLLLAFWLASVPLIVTSVLSNLADRPLDFPAAWAEVSLAQGTQSDWTFGLAVTGLTLGVHLLVYGPIYLATRRPKFQFLHSTAALLIGIALFQSLTALTRLPWPGGGPALLTNRTFAAAVRLAWVLPFLTLVLGRVDAITGQGTLRQRWRMMGLRRWSNPSAMWQALAVGAVVTWPWVLVGSLGSSGTTMANVLHALPSTLGEEIFFRGIAFACLWRSSSSHTWSAAGSLLLYVAAQGGSVLPFGDPNVLLRFVAALLLGLLTIELTVRSSGSIWPAIAVHLFYEWFSLAFVDPRSHEEILVAVVRVYAPLAAGGMGLVLWAGRKISGAVASRQPSAGSVIRPRLGRLWSPGLACIAWVGVVILYLSLGTPGFHPDGFLIFLDEQADLSAAAAIADPVERRSWVYQALVDTAERSQAGLRAELERRGLTYRAHYLFNMVEVLGRPGLRSALAQQAGVASVLFQPGVRPYPHTVALPDLDAYGPRGVEWNLREIGADQLWALGITGQGITVGSADTGVAWAHPALMDAYLGWDGESANHNYHWYDPWDASTEPWDDSGHGTHTIGTVVGWDGENQIGVAPGAKWIACRNMRHGIGNPGSYVSCMEFLLAPFPLGGDPFHDGDPARGAQIVNNSWGCPPEEGCQPDTLRIALENLRAAGQMLLVSAGNEGPACGTIQDPVALYDAVFSVGAVAPGDRAAGFSSRGPVTADGSGRLKPDVVAPGVDIRSAVPAGYASLGGTSMAAPHVTGVVALIWSMAPSLVGEVDRTERLLVDTAQRLTVDAAHKNTSACLGAEERLGLVCGCAGDGPGTVPNHIYGWGKVDAWAAAQVLLQRR